VSRHTVIGLFGLAVAVVTFLALLVQWCIDVANRTWEMYFISKLVEYLIIAITIIVVAVPEVWTASCPCS